jgi:hypothetical protein
MTDIFIKCQNCKKYIQSFEDCYYKVCFAHSVEYDQLFGIYCINCVNIKKLKGVEE